MVSKIAIFTESEANSQQCCGPEGTGLFNDIPYPARWCMASRCMAWRWYETNIKSEPGGMYEPNGETYGYCGLSGSPSPVGGRWPST